MRVTMIAWMAGILAYGAGAWAASGEELVLSTAAGRVDAGVFHHPARADGTRPVWIYLSVPADERSTAAARMNRSAVLDLSERAWQRRELRRTAAGLWDERDRPVDTRRVAQVRAGTKSIRVVSRWLRAVSADATEEQIAALAVQPWVTRITPVLGGRRIEPVQPETSGAAEPTAADSLFMPAGPAVLNYGNTAAQLQQIKADQLHALGYTGAGVVLAVLDTGFYKSHESIAPSRIIAEWDFIQNDGNTQNEAGDPSTQHNHGTACMTIAAGYKDGTHYGPAYQADLILCKTEDVANEQPIEEDWYVGGLEFAELHGADVVTSSLGYIDWYSQSQLDGLTAVTTLAVNIATANGMFCVTAAGNDGGPGPRLIAPADAFEVITVGAVDSSGNLAGFSSRGPTADGRVKPEVLARGVGTWYGSAGGPTSYSNGSGTSYATPLVAGVVACLVQAHPDWTVPRMRGALIRTAGDYVISGTYDPAFGRGYGIIDGQAAHQKIFIPPDMDYDDDVDGDDVALLVDCVTGPQLGPPAVGCDRADLDDDSDVDQTDFGLLQPCLAGPGEPPDPACFP